MYFMIDQHRKYSKPSPSDVKEALRILLSTHASLVTAKDKNGCTPLMLAAKSCNTPVLEGLLSKATPQDKTDAGNLQRSLIAFALTT